MPRALKVLLVEDNPHDAELVLRELRRAGFEPDWQRVETEPDFTASLKEAFELIISDFAMPEFNGLRALDLLNASGRDIPFIIVSGTIGEETAVAAMKQGAMDYLIKDRLARLGQAVNRALEETRLRRERAIAAQALVIAEAKFRGLFENSVTGIYQTSPDGRLLAANPALARIAGYESPEAMIAAVGNLAEQVYVDPVDRARFQQQIQAHGVVQGFEARMRRPDGTPFWISSNAWLARDRDGRVCYEGELEDITARKLAGQQLRESEERFRQLAENINEVFWITDVTKEQIIYISPAYETVWGRPREDLYRSSQAWVQSIHREDQTRVLEAVRQKQPQGTYDETYRILRPDGTVRWIHDKAFPVRSDDGTVQRIVGVAEDITEARLLEEKFLRAQRLEAVGSLASGVAHDMNNILAPMLMAAGLLKGKLHEQRDRDILTMVEHSAQRGAGIIGQLLTFSRGTEGARVAIQASHLLKEMRHLMQETFPRHLEIECDCPKDLWSVLADATQLHQVLMNLCVNARDAMAAGGRLTVRARNIQLAADEAARQLVQAGPYVEITVTDTGHGIPAEIVGRIFDPFFTTKEAGKGTGLGLATVASIVKSHQGILDVESEPGTGSTFRVRLPAVVASALEPEPVLHASPIGRQQLILIVDDEKPIREALRAVLEKHSYRVLAAENGEEAIRLFIPQRAAVRLVLTDMMMPGMGGLALIRSLRVVEPALPVIACSGLGLEENQQNLEALGVTETLAKPFTPAHLLDAIGRVLRN
jgi:PAS domain S-box-containing protein